MSGNRLLLALMIFPWIFTVTPWATQQTCAPDPVAPPDGWSFPGAIISMVSDDGVRALRSETMRTYYVTFAGSNFIEGGALSPSGAWYAVPYGYIETAAAFDVRYKVNELRVYSTNTVPQIRARLSWQATFQIDDIPQMVWLDDESLVFPQGSFLDGLSPQVVKPFINETTHYAPGIYASLSPDHTRGFADDADAVGLFDLQSGALLKRFSAEATAFHWSPDSTLFPALDEANGERWLSLYDRDGGLSAQILDIGRDRVLWNFHWSGTRFVFSAYDPYKNENTLYIGDITTQVITDTCILLVNRFDGTRVSGVAWSPDGTQLALVTSQVFDDKNAVQIYDLETNIRYGIGVYSGGLVGWGGS